MILKYINLRGEITLIPIHRLSYDDFTQTYIGYLTEDNHRVFRSPLNDTQLIEVYYNGTLMYADKDCYKKARKVDYEGGN